ncbi:DNA-directed RNA polymerase I subunit RPA12 [Vombatus ursinus]|uniref:DNA-directed RNA polymerase I subunit RPA12 n=1 Tax=Vombatus ursinus TaxID=29139 RepID=A0A4X2JN19_VOMUR|nr:DNA-directed RNA polymerase I subunit RPA12 [Vombatus ursinus]XP_027732055.1 DNA-directed RNA polymerase I subunit RPA12 [Vombatus ursinus]
MLAPGAGILGDWLFTMDRPPASSSFHSDSDFCPECGSILPLPGTLDTVTCPRCGFSIDVREFEGKVVETSVVFHKLGTTALMVSEEDGPEFQGPVIDRRCSNCGHEGMAYHTRQMRSADEGQTVFYTCTNCRFQEKEDS